MNSNKNSSCNTTVKIYSNVLKYDDIVFSIQIYKFSSSDFQAMRRIRNLFWHYQINLLFKILTKPYYTG
ncbi:hypothetical protein BV372_15845 [Nostoc sp. T09]|nr:hypothetical protein BV372_15845 [Nostoc sp. T09]